MIGSKLPLTAAALCAFAVLAGLAQAQVSIVGSTVRTLPVGPGGTIEDRLVVRNDGHSMTGIVLYTTDYLFTASGGSTFGPAGSHERSNAAWFEWVGPSVYDLPPGSEVTIEIRGTVPADAALKGSYWSTLMVEERKPDNGGQDQAGVGIRIVQRRAVQIITDVGGGSVDLRFEQPRIASDREAGATELQLELHNLGSSHSHAGTRLEVLDAATGSLVLAVDGRRALVYPGTSVSLRFDIDELDAGFYQALVLADGGDMDVFGIRYALDLRGGD